MERRVGKVVWRLRYYTMEVSHTAREEAVAAIHGSPTNK